MPETNYYQRPSNFVAEINGHLIVRDVEDDRCAIWTRDVGWWAFNLSEAASRRQCEAVSPYQPKEVKS